MAAVAGALLLTLLPPGAAARLPGPRSFATGFVDDKLFESLSGSTASKWLSTARSLHASWAKLDVDWFVIAPASPTSAFRASDAADPQYHFLGLDQVIKNAVGEREHVLLSVIGPSPVWAHNPDPVSGNRNVPHPNVAAFGAFAHALAERYSGRFPDPQNPGHALPRVNWFQAWNEPNEPVAIAPQWVRGAHGGWSPASPGIYRAMLNSFYANVKAAQPGAHVLAAGLAPFGDAPGVARMKPVYFLRQLLCLNRRLRRTRCAHPVHFDAYDVHPYSASPVGSTPDRDNVRLPDLGRLKRVVRAALRRHTLFPHGAKPLWISELSWVSNPPDRGGIPLRRQARYVSWGFYAAWRQGISHFIWLELEDAPAMPPFAGFGVYFANGRPKPAAAAFGFPFAAVHAKRGRTILWGRAPRPGRVAIQRRTRHGWKTVARVRTTRWGIFYAVRPLKRHLVLRARLGSRRSLAFATA